MMKTTRKLENVYVPLIHLSLRVLALLKVGYIKDYLQLYLCLLSSSVLDYQYSLSTSRHCHLVSPKEVGTEEVINLQNDRVVNSQLGFRVVEVPSRNLLELNNINRYKTNNKIRSIAINESKTWNINKKLLYFDLSNIHQVSRTYLPIKNIKMILFVICSLCS